MLAPRHLALLAAGGMHCVSAFTGGHDSYFVAARGWQFRVSSQSHRQSPVNRHFSSQRPEYNSRTRTGRPFQLSMQSDPILLHHPMFLLFFPVIALLPFSIEAAELMLSCPVTWCVMTQLAFLFLVGKVRDIGEEVESKVGFFVRTSFLFLFVLTLQGNASVTDFLILHYMILNIRLHIDSDFTYRILCVS